jgi:hypothetical protein
MFNCIINFFKPNNNKAPVFDAQYRKGYNKLWINSLKNYHPH